MNPYTKIIKPTKHCEERFKERIFDTNDVIYYVNDAFENGQTSEGIANAILRRYMNLLTKRTSEGCIVKVHDGVIYIFDASGNKAITVYQIPTIRQINNILSLERKY